MNDNLVKNKKLRLDIMLKGWFAIIVHFEIIRILLYIRVSYLGESDRKKVEIKYSVNSAIYI